MLDQKSSSLGQIIEVIVPSELQQDLQIFGSFFFFGFKIEYILVTGLKTFLPSYE